MSYKSLNRCIYIWLYNNTVIYICAFSCTHCPLFTYIIWWHSWHTHLLKFYFISILKILAEILKASYKNIIFYRSVIIFYIYIWFYPLRLKTINICIYSTSQHTYIFIFDITVRICSVHVSIYVDILHIRLVPFHIMGKRITIIYLCIWYHLCSLCICYIILIAAVICQICP